MYNITPHICLLFVFLARLCQLLTQPSIKPIHNPRIRQLGLRLEIKRSTPYLQYRRLSFIVNFNNCLLVRNTKRHIWWLQYWIRIRIQGFTIGKILWFRFLSSWLFHLNWSKDTIFKEFQLLGYIYNRFSLLLF